MSAGHVDTVLFDFDGTLMLTEERNGQVWDAVFDSLEIHLEPLARRQIMGHRIGEVVALLEPYADRSVSLDRLERLYFQHDAVIPRAAEQLAPGASELIASLRAQEVTLGVVTSGRSHIVHDILVHLGVDTAFAVIIGGEGVAKGKPDPEPYEAAITALGSDPMKTVAIEDSPAGVRSATDAGLRCIAVTSTHDRADLTRATWIVDHLADCLPVLATT